jgi:hypothetical protein
MTHRQLELAHPALRITPLTGLGRRSCLVTQSRTEEPGAARRPAANIRLLCVFGEWRNF